MIILDTNVLSALMRKSPDAAVAEWLDEQPWQSIWITSITLFEARLGIESLPRGARRNSLAKALDGLLNEDLEHRILDFDSEAAVQAAKLAAARRARGRPGDFRDTQIAGIALARRASIATRNIRHFEDAGISLHNPWGEEH